MRRMRRPRGLSDVMCERRQVVAPAQPQTVLALTTEELVRIARMIEATNCSYQDAVKSIRFKVWGI